MNEIIQSCKKFKIKMNALLKFQQLFEANWDKYLSPVTILDNIGGYNRVVKIINQVKQLMVKDLVFNRKAPLDVNIIMCVSSLINNQPDDFLKYFINIKKNYRVTEYDFFVLKKNAWIVISDSVMAERYKQYIMEKVESIRPLLLNPAQHFIKVFKKNFQHNLDLNYNFQVYYRNNQEGSSQFLKQLSLYLFQGDTISNFVQQAQRNMKTAMNERYFDILEQMIQGSISPDIASYRLQVKDIEYKIHKIRFSLKLGPTIFSIADEQTSDLDAFISNMQKYIQRKLLLDRKMISMQDTRIYNTEYLNFYLKLLLNEYQVFHITDSFYAIQYFAVHTTLFMMWMQCIKNYLIEVKVPEESAQLFVQLVTKFSTYT